MTTPAWSLLVLLLAALVALGWPLGRYIAALKGREKTASGARS